MTTTMGIRELARSTKELSNYDYIEIEDKKSHKKRGLFVSQKYAKDIEKILKKRISKEKKIELDSIMKFAGILNGKTNNMTIQELKAMKKKRY